MGGVLQYRPDTYQFEVEQIESTSYPGISSIYRSHYVQVDILEHGLPLFAGRGLPDFSDFTTTASALGEVGLTRFWRWYDVEAALHAGITKFLPPICYASKSLPMPKTLTDGVDGTRTVEAFELPDEAALGRFLARG